MEENINENVQAEGSVREYLERLRQTLADPASGFSEEQAEILRFYLGTGDAAEYSPKQAAEHFGISLERFRRIFEKLYRRAFGHLRRSRRRMGFLDD